MSRSEQQPVEIVCLSSKMKCIVHMCLCTKRGRTLCASLMAPVLLALLLPMLNVHIIYPAFKQVVVSSLEEDSKRLGLYILPPALKHSVLTEESFTPEFFGNIYRLEHDFDLIRIRVFSTHGIILYSTDPAETGTQNTSPYFQEKVTKGISLTKFVTKNTNTLEGETVQTDVVETYVPIMKDAQFLGAFEMYYDVTKRMAKLNQLTLYSTIAMICMSCSLIFVVLYLLRKEVKFQQELHRADALKADVERITRHDMKSPVLSLLAGITYLEQFTDLSVEQSEMTSDMRKAANTALDMINRSLDLYKMETGSYDYTPTDMDFLAIVRQTETDLSRLAMDLGVTTRITLAGDPLTETDTFPIKAEESLCYSLVANLLKNAIEASPSGGIVAVKLSEDEGHKLQIHNNGTVPADIRDTFFDKYTTSGKSTGTGLGTYSALLMTKTMGGSITMTSSEEDGTTITVELPHHNKE